MKQLIQFAALMGIGLLAIGATHAMDLSAYQRPNGAITVHRYGANVDPYFAMKALWVGRQFNDPSPRETMAWIHWLLPRQNKDGTFSRFCEREQQWEICAAADADDSTLALWIALLHEAAPKGMSPTWADSVTRAEQALERLHDKRAGTYRVADHIVDALLMDNAEIVDALRRVGELRRKAGDSVGGARYLARAHALRLGIGKVFHADQSRLLRWTSGEVIGEKFYPHRLAHLYPWLHHIKTDTFGDMLDWKSWLDRYGNEWLERTDDVYPWGLVALVAYHAKSYKVVERWIDNAPPHRDSGHWNVLEEAVLQGLARARLEGKWQ